MLNFHYFSVTEKYWKFTHCTDSYLEPKWATVSWNRLRWAEICRNGPRALFAVHSVVLGENLDRLRFTLRFRMVRPVCPNSSQSWRLNNLAKSLNWKVCFARDGYNRETVFVKIQRRIFRPKVTIGAMCKLAPFFRLTSPLYPFI